MKTGRLICHGTLALLVVGAARSAYAQKEPHEEQPRGQPRPEAHHQDAKPQHQEPPARAKAPEAVRPPPAQVRAPMEPQVTPRERAPRPQPTQPRELPAPPPRAQGPGKAAPPALDRSGPREPPPRAQAPQAPPAAPNRPQTGEHRATWPQHRARDWASEHHGWQERGGYTGYRIPEVRFHGAFGPEHAFRIHSYPLVMVGGYPRFQYNGFWFSVLDPWPEYWADNWYDDDDLYIEYADEGYYLHNRRHPDDRVAIVVYVN